MNAVKVLLPTDLPAPDIKFVVVRVDGTRIVLLSGWSLGEGGGGQQERSEVSKLLDCRD
jgi:hypothetical protein